MTSYHEVSEKTAEYLHLTPKLNESLALFKMNGTRILDKDVCVNKKKPWLMGNYLLCIKKSGCSAKAAE